MGRSRALAGTREGYRPCPTCGHMLLRHLARGAGPCCESIVAHEIDADGRTITTSTRCTCTGAPTEGELHR